MDANELAMIAYDVMPGGIMTETGKGEMFGVLKMALRTLEAQHEALLAEADEEAAEARRLVAAQISTPFHSHSEFEELRKERDGWKTEASELQKRIDNLNAENARLHRSLEERMTAQIPGAVKVADEPKRIHYGAATGHIEA